MTTEPRKDLVVITPATVPADDLLAALQRMTDGTFLAVAVKVEERNVYVLGRESAVYALIDQNKWWRHEEVQAWGFPGDDVQPDISP